MIRAGLVNQKAKSARDRREEQNAFLLISLLKLVQLLEDCMDEFSLLFGEVTAIDTRKSQGVRGRRPLSAETQRRCCSSMSQIQTTKLLYIRGPDRH